jgi:hypothetical protein
MYHNKARAGVKTKLSVVFYRSFEGFNALLNTTGGFVFNRFLHCGIELFFINWFQQIIKRLCFYRL